jgi:hypothetical protein
MLLLTQICDLLRHASGLAARPDEYYCDPKWFPSALKFFDVEIL